MRSLRLKGSPAHVSSLAGRASARIRPVIRGPSGRSSRSCGPAFLLPFSRRHSLHRHPVPPRNSAPLTVGLPPRLRIPAPARRTLARFTRSARMRPGPGRALSLPRGQRCSPAIGASAAAACRLSAAGPCHPGETTQPGVCTWRGIGKSSLVVALYRSFPWPVAAMAGTAVLGLFRKLRTRPVRNRPRTSRRGQVEHKPVATSLASARPPRLAHSLRATSCRNALYTPGTAVSAGRRLIRGRRLPPLSGRPLAPRYSNPARDVSV